VPGKPTEQMAEEQVKVLTIEKTTLIVEKMQRMATLLELGGYAEWSVVFVNWLKNMSWNLMIPNTFFSISMVEWDL
jgi:hypothetical protein